MLAQPVVSGVHSRPESGCGRQCSDRRAAGEQLGQQDGNLVAGSAGPRVYICS